MVLIQTHTRKKKHFFFTGFDRTVKGYILIGIHTITIRTKSDTKIVNYC